jgi:hypothetical protein
MAHAAARAHDWRCANSFLKVLTTTYSRHALNSQVGIELVIGPKEKKESCVEDYTEGQQPLILPKNQSVIFG